MEHGKGRHIAGSGKLEPELLESGEEILIGPGFHGTLFNLARFRCPHWLTGFDLAEREIFLPGSNGAASVRNLKRTVFLDIYSEIVTGDRLADERLPICFFMLLTRAIS